MKDNFVLITTNIICQGLKPILKDSEPILCHGNTRNSSEKC